MVKVSGMLHSRLFYLSITLMEILDLPLYTVSIKYIGEVIQTWDIHIAVAGLRNFVVRGFFLSKIPSTERLYLLYTTHICTSLCKNAIFEIFRIYWNSFVFF